MHNQIDRERERGTKQKHRERHQQIVKSTQKKLRSNLTVPANDKTKFVCRFVWN